MYKERERTRERRGLTLILIHGLFLLTGGVPKPYGPLGTACLSLHQPWASLLVAGVKTVEGRSWASEHRGPLWIASTAKPPTDEDIAEVL